MDCAVVACTERNAVSNNTCLLPATCRQGMEGWLRHRTFAYSMASSRLTSLWSSRSHLLPVSAMVTSGDPRCGDMTNNRGRGGDWVLVLQGDQHTHSCGHLLELVDPALGRREGVLVRNVVHHHCRHGVPVVPVGASTRRQTSGEQSTGAAGGGWSVRARTWGRGCGIALGRQCPRSQTSPLNWVRIWRG